MAFKIEIFVKVLFMAYANKPVIDFFSFQGRARSSASSVGEKRASNASMVKPYNSSGRISL